MAVDFEQIKQRVTMEEAAALLGLQLIGGSAQKKAECPKCESKSLAINTDRRIFFCHSAKVGGDVISLVAHCKDLSVKDAATLLDSPRSPVKASNSPATQGFKSLDYLESDHPLVETIGFDVEIAGKLGVGYAPKGILRGTVAIPIRDEHGVLIAYIGITEATLPPTLRGANIVEISKTA